MNLIFQNSQKEERVIAKVNSDEEAYCEIEKFCTERDYKIPYSRCWNSIEGNRTFYDVGSHTEFFILER